MKRWGGKWGDTAAAAKSHQESANLTIVVSGNLSHPEKKKDEKRR